MKQKITIQGLCLLSLEGKLNDVNDYINLIYNNVLSITVIDYYFSKFYHNHFILNLLFQHQEIPLKIIKKYWDKFSSQTKNIIIAFQNISESFLNEKWKDLDETNITYICDKYNLSKEFTRNHLNDFSANQLGLLAQTYSIYNDDIRKKIDLIRDDIVAIDRIQKSRKELYRKLIKAGLI